jgi:hypothetical protein
MGTARGTSATSGPTAFRPPRAPDLGRRRAASVHLTPLGTGLGGRPLHPAGLFPAALHPGLLADRFASRPGLAPRRGCLPRRRSPLIAGVHPASSLWLAGPPGLDGCTGQPGFMPHRPSGSHTARQIGRGLGQAANWAALSRLPHPGDGWIVDRVDRSADIVAPVAISGRDPVGPPETIRRVRTVVAAIPVVIVGVVVPVVPMGVDVPRVIGRRVIVRVVEERIVERVVGVIVRVVVIAPVGTPVEQADG